MAAMRPGDAIVATEISGEFVLPRDRSAKLAFIAGGIGITPVRSMIKYMVDEGERRDADAGLLGRSAADIAFRELFREAGRLAGA